MQAFLQRQSHHSHFPAEMAPWPCHQANTPAFIYRKILLSSTVKDGVKNGCARGGRLIQGQSHLLLGLKSFTTKQGLDQTNNTLLRASKTTY